MHFGRVSIGLKAERRHPVGLFLEDCIQEMYTLERLRAHCDLNEVAVDCGLVLFLVRAIQEKIKYLDRKYEIDRDDEGQFFIADYGDFIRKKESICKQEAPRRKGGKSPGAL